MTNGIRLLFILGLLALMTTVQARPIAADDAKRRPPNILFVLMDNIGQDWFGCCGSLEGQTPEIDKLAASGVRFRNCYVTPLCSTSRHVFMTGRYPFRTGWHIHHDAAIYGGGYFDWNREITFARVLKSAGYATAISGKWQINNLFDQPDALKKHGFDEHFIFPEGPRGHPAHTQRYWDPYIIQDGRRIEAEGKFGPRLFTDYLIDFMRRHRDRPFLAFYSTILTHVPVTKTPLNKDEVLTEREQLAGMVRYADVCIGRLVAALDESGLRYAGSIRRKGRRSGLPSVCQHHGRGRHEGGQHQRAIHRELPGIGSRRACERRTDRQLGRVPHICGIGRCHKPGRCGNRRPVVCLDAAW